MVLAIARQMSLVKKPPRMVRTQGELGRADHLQRVIIGTRCV